MVGHPPRRSPRGSAFRPVPVLRRPRGLARTARLAADHHRPRAVSAARWRFGRHRSLRLGPRRASATTRADPTPTIGGRLLSPDGGYRDDTALASSPRRAQLHQRRAAPPIWSCTVARSRSWRTAPTTRSSTCSSGSAKSTPKGRSRNVSDATGGWRSRSTTSRLELDAISHRFRAGTRIRVLIAGGSHPRFDRNLGNGEPTSTGSELASVHPRGALRFIPRSCSRSALDGRLRRMAKRRNGNPLAVDDRREFRRGRHRVHPPVRHTGSAGAGLRARLSDGEHRFLSR